MTITSDHDEQRETDRGRETIELPAVSDDSAPIAAAAAPEVSEDDQATIEQLEAVSAPSNSAPSSSPRARKTTLVAAISRPRSQQPAADEDETSLADAIPDELDEWSVADQPTIQLPPRSARVRPDFLETHEHPSWPPSPRLTAQAAQAAEVARLAPSPAPRTPVISRREPISRPPEIQKPRLAAPDGREVPPTPADGTPRSALPNPRMERFQELRRHRVEPEALEDGKPVTEAVTKWWNDARPGLSRALKFQHEARESGTFPIPAYEPSAMSLLGDVFGRVSASARQFGGRAQAIAGPTIKRIHDQAEHAAQAIVDRFEGNDVRQQEPFLGPGRIAVFFRSGVTVGQAQRLLSASQARPMRIIPRKHGFLAFVKPGLEADVSERLKVHPYVRDVAYVEYDEFGDSAAQPAF